MEPCDLQSQRLEVVSRHFSGIKDVVARQLQVSHANQQSFRSVQSYGIPPMCPSDRHSAYCIWGLQIDIGRLHDVKLAVDSMALDLALLPNPSGWCEPPTPAQLLDKLGNVIKATQLRKVGGFLIQTSCCVLFSYPFERWGIVTCC